MNGVVSLYSLRWLAASCLGVLCFLWFQIMPGLESYATSPDKSNVMDRASARSLAILLAADRFGVAPGDIARLDLTHVSDSDAVGYMQREKLADTFDQGYDDRFPTDVYRSDIKLSNGEWLQLSLHMSTGKLVSWRKPGAAPESIGEQEAVRALADSGYEPAEWEATGEKAEDGAFVFQFRKSELGEAKIQLLIKPGAEAAYRIALPASFESYILHQQKLAASMSAIGYVLPEIVLFVLAIVYASMYSGYTSFRRGWFLASLYFVLYLLFTLNMRAGFRSQADTGNPVSDQGVTALIVVNAVVLAATAALTYFAAVGGDGLWRSMGRSLWPRWPEADYGRRVLRSMRQGYALAFIALGAQSLILFALEHLIGSFTSSDASQSSYNLTYPWLMPLVACCAGIAEELLFRYFGIALFRRWLTGIARRLLRREPSARAARALTFFAMIPPSIVWAFGHVGYPIYPTYTRLIELTLLGLLFGWFMLRFGLMTAIFAHITLDAILIGTQLMFDQLPYDIYSGAFSIAMPAMVGFAIWLLHRRLRGGSGPEAAPPPAAEPLA